MRLGLGSFGMYMFLEGWLVLVIFVGLSCEVWLLAVVIADGWFLGYLNTKICYNEQKG